MASTIQQDVEMLFCSDCASNYESGFFCDYCEQVYSQEENTFLDGKLWIGCDGARCRDALDGRWNHAQCEVLYGTVQSYREAA